MQTTTAAEITIQVNGGLRTVAHGSTIGDLLAGMDLDHRLVVVEHNLEILPRTTVRDAVLSEGDTLEIVHFVGGG